MIGGARAETRPRRRSGARQLALAALVTLLTLLTLAHGAAAEPGATIATVAWGGAERARDTARAAAEDELRRAGLTVLALEPALAGRLVACLGSDAPTPCLPPLLRAAGLVQVLALELAREPAQVRLTAQLAAAQGARVALDFAYCAPCDDPALAAAARALTRRVLTDGAAHAAAATIAVRTEPPGATIHLDGHMVDAPRDELAVSPGVHTLFLQRSGYRAELRTVRVREGQRAVVEVRLAPAAPTDALGASGAPGAREAAASATRAPATAAPDRRGHRRAWAWALLLGGAGAVVAGGALLALDEDVSANPGRAHRPQLLDTAPLGVALGSTGVALLGGALLLWSTSDAPRAGAVRTEPAALTPGRAWWVSWVHRH